MNENNDEKIILELQKLNFKLLLIEILVSTIVAILLKY